MSKQPSPPSTSPSSDADHRVVRRVLADGTVKSYRYPRKPQPKGSLYAPGSVAAALLAYEHSPEWRGLAEQTRHAYKDHTRILAEIGAQQLSQIKRKDLLGTRDVIAVKRGHGAANAFLKVTSTFLGWCVSRDLIEHNPVRGARKLPGGHLKAWTMAQAQFAMAPAPDPLPKEGRKYMPEAFRRVVVLAFHTGQRRGDLIRLPWSAYDGHTIRLRQGKTGVSLVIPVHPDLRVELDAWKRTASSTMILTTMHGRPWQPVYMSTRMPLAMAEIGLPRLNVHGLRKLAAANMADAGCTVHEIAAITGHKTLSMVALYTASADQERLAKSAVGRLETFSQRDGKKAAND